MWGEACSDCSPKRYFNSDGPVSVQIDPECCGDSSCRNVESPKSLQLMEACIVQSTRGSGAQPERAPSRFNPASAKDMSGGSRWQNSCSGCFGTLPFVQMIVWV